MLKDMNFTDAIGSMFTCDSVYIAAHDEYLNATCRFMRLCYGNDAYWKIGALIRC